MLRKLLKVSLLSLALFGCSEKFQSSQTAGISEQAGGINLKVKKVTLDNGLRVLIYENHGLPIFSYYTFFDVGGRHESKGTTGATHFLEHMMFKGSGNFGPGQFDSTIESNGGSTNAYTNFDNTVYYESLPSNTIDKIIAMEADRMTSILLHPVALNGERQVVFEERKVRYENSPRGKLYLALMQNIFENTPYGGSVIGDVEDLKALTRENLMSFYKNFYTPDNAIIVVAGDVDADKVIEQIEKKYGDLKPSTQEIQDYIKSKDDPSLYAHQGRYGRDVKIHASSPTPMFMMGFKGKPLGDRDGFVMDILSSIIGQGESSYFFQKYVKGKKPVLSRFSSANYTLMKNGVFWLSGQLLAGKNLNRFKRSLLRDLSKVCEEAITERTLAKTKNQYLIDYYAGIQTNAGVAQFLGMREMYFNDYNYYKKEFEIYESIGLEEVKQSCQNTFKDRDYIMVSVWNKHPKKRNRKR